MTDITIPTEAVEAATDAVHDFFHNTHSRMFSRELAISALRAGLAAWPGMHTEDHDTPWPPRIILPLSKELRDE